MIYLSKLPQSIQGTLLIIAGALILFDALGYATQILHALVLCLAVVLIVRGIMEADIVGRIYRLIKKNKNESKPPLE